MNINTAQKTSVQKDLLVILTPWVNFINILWAAFTHADPDGVKFQLSHQNLYAFGIQKCKSCTKNIDEIYTWMDSSK